jgi:hypothetical protein
MFGFTRGTIYAEGHVVQRRDDAGQLMLTADGHPQLRLAIPLQTDDNGIHVLYVFGAIKFAIRDAVVKSGDMGLEVGGTFTVDNGTLQYSPPT